MQIHIRSRDVVFRLIQLIGLNLSHNKQILYCFADDEDIKNHCIDTAR